MYETKPLFSYFPWTKEIRQWKMENGKWKTDQQRHLTIGMSVTSVHNEEEKTKTMFINDDDEVYEIIPQINLI